MAQPATTPKIEELRFRLKTDPKSRLFYPLAEELRKVGQFSEAEQVLHTGLVNHPSYLAAWVSLGRVQRELKNEHGAVESLSKAMQLDPGNVVAARLLADAYLSLGDKLEALKKYKLVHALMPGEEALQKMIERLDNELNPVTIAPPAPAPAPVAAPEPASIPEPEPEPVPEAIATPEPAAPVPPPPPAPTPIDDMPWGDEAAAPAPAQLAAKQQRAVETGDAEPMSLAHDESPFEEPLGDAYSSAALEVEAPAGMHIARAPLEAEVPLTFDDAQSLPTPEAPPIASSPADESDIFAPAEPLTAPPEEDITNTLTMADLYARQGLVDDARHIYDSILQRDPSNAAVREKLDALNPPAPPPAPVVMPSRVGKVARLENWLSKIKRREVSGV